ncbi:MAG: helix-turn-helix domain-containing protein [Acidimicrobiales bacterium]
MTTTRLETGLPPLDELLGGLLAGDNVVWVTDRDERYEVIEQAFLRSSIRRGPTLQVVCTRAELERPRPAGVDVLDATVGSSFGQYTPLCDEIERRMAVTPRLSILFDGLDELDRRWGHTETTRFFTRMCPSMLQTGAITYWRATRRLGPGFLERVRQVTQCLLEVRGEQLQVHKAESRPADVQGSVHQFRLAGDTVHLATSATGGRLARGLVAVRRDLGITQAQFAEAAGVTASAMSQAENGTRGLSLDTLLTLRDRLGVSLDRLVDARPRPGYQLARHDRSRAASGGTLVALADDTGSGLRAFLVMLGAGEDDRAPLDHRGVELVAVVRGLVQIDVGDDTPVLRAGDSLLATTAPIAGWRNLRPEPAVFYWVLRD